MTENATNGFANLAADAPARCLTKDLMAGECKWAEVGIGPTSSLAFQVRLVEALNTCDDFETFYVRLGEPGQPGYFYDENPDDAAFNDALAGARGCNIVSVTWAGLWNIDESPYGEKRLFDSLGKSAEGAGEKELASPLGPIPVVVQRRRITGPVYEQAWITDVALPRCTRSYLVHVLAGDADEKRIEKELCEQVKAIAVNLM